MLDIIFNMYKIKYVKLNELLKTEYPGLKPYSTVSVFINLENIINKLATTYTDEYLRVKNEEKIFEFISNVINIAAHYRAFFISSKIYCKVYLYLPYPFKMSLQKNKTINYEYRKYYEYKFNKNPTNYVLSETISSSIEFIQTICEYIDGVYFITSGNIENSVIPYIIMNENQDVDANFIVSTNQYDFQYVNIGGKILVPNKENSMLLTSDNIIDYVCSNHNIVNNSSVTAGHLPFILSVIGNKQRNIYNLKGYGVKTVFKALQTAINKSVISPDTTNINLLLHLINEKFHSQVLSNFYCTDIVYQYNNLLKKDIYYIMSQLKDKYDNNSLKKINDMYFTQYPINIIEVTKQVASKKRNVIF